MTLELVKSHTTQKLDVCQSNEIAKVLVEGPNTQMVTLVAYGEMIKAIVQGEEVSHRSLLKAKTF